MFMIYKIKLTLKIYIMCQCVNILHILTYLSEQPYEFGTVIVPILQMHKLRQRVVKAELGFKLSPTLGYMLIFSIMEVMTTN